MIALSASDPIPEESSSIITKFNEDTNSIQVPSIFIGIALPILLIAQKRRNGEKRFL